MSLQNGIAQSVVAVEYSDFVSTEWYLEYDTKQSDGDAGALGNANSPFIAIAPRSPLAWNGTTCKFLSLGQTELFDI